VPPAPGASLPFTGARTAQLALFGLFLLATGTALVFGRRRRRSVEH
jgi:LPXTG-motif cell wall-anchored protein